MNRMPVAERREQLIAAALTVASRDGIEAATVRAVAAQAGVSLGVVHYCFRDKSELMGAVAQAITAQNALNGLAEVPEGADLQEIVEAVIEGLWHGIRASRGVQLLSYELTTSSLRSADLSGVAAQQYEGSWAAADRVLAKIETMAAVRWAIPRDRIARTVVAVLDGFSLAWLVDGDDDLLLQGMQGFGKYLLTMAQPASAADAVA